MIESRPPWLAVKAPTLVQPILGIDAGESAAIGLAQELHADLLLIDDLDGRYAATQRGIRIIGTLGVLELAASRDLISLPAVIARVRTTSFRASDKLLAEALQRDTARRQNRDLGDKA